jgi:hypothetical protein
VTGDADLLSVLGSAVPVTGLRAFLELLAVTSP